MKLPYFTSAVFNCNYTCNDVCSFCFNAQYMNKVKELSLEEIKENYYYVKKKFGVNKVIISGGEPSLYSKFWEMLDFFYNQTDSEVIPSLNTNSIKFAEEKEYKKLYTLLKNSTKKNKQISISFSTVSTLKTPTQREKNKIEGVRNTIKAGLLSNCRTLVVIIITKDNYQALPEIADFLIDLNNKYAFQSSNNLSVQIRYPYLGERKNSAWMFDEQIEKTIITNPDKPIPYLRTFIKKMLPSELELRLNNIPLCNLGHDFDFSSLKEQTREKRFIERRISLDSKNRFSKLVANEYLGTSQNYLECKKCKLESRCTKIQPAYLEHGYIKKLLPLI